MECRRCDVHCDKVVYPGACLSRGCPFVYSYEAWGHTYVGCMQKVYDVEIDLDMLRAAEERRPGFGAIRARAPAAADVQGRGRAHLRVALRTSSAASTPSSTSCRSASRRSACSPRSRAAAEQRVLAPPPDRPRGEPDEPEHEQHAARRARARRRRRCRAREARREPCSGPWPCVGAGAGGGGAPRCRRTVA